jgi:hypothetical protein
MSRAPIDPRLAGSEFAPVNTLCRHCGKPTNTVSLICAACANQEYLRQALEYAREVLTLQPQQAIEAGHSKDGVLHLALFSAKFMAWCGAELSEARIKRKRHPPDRFPSELCPACAAHYREAARCP